MHKTDDSPTIKHSHVCSSGKHTYDEADPTEQVHPPWISNLDLIGILPWFEYEPSGCVGTVEPLSPWSGSELHLSCSLASASVGISSNTKVDARLEARKNRCGGREGQRKTTAFVLKVSQQQELRCFFFFRFLLNTVTACVTIMYQNRKCIIVDINHIYSQWRY